MRKLSFSVDTHPRIIFRCPSVFYFYKGKMQQTLPGKYLPLPESIERKNNIQAEIECRAFHLFTAPASQRLL